MSYPGFRHILLWYEHGWDYTRNLTELFYMDFYSEEEVSAILEITPSFPESEQVRLARKEIFIYVK